MKINVDIYFTLALASLALVVGYLLIDRIKLLASYSLPAAVVGGLLFAALLTLLRGAAGIEVGFDGSLLTPLNIAFFTSVGLSADARALAKGGKTLLVFFVLVAAGLVMQNAIGVSMAVLFDMSPVNGPAGRLDHAVGGAWHGCRVGRQVLRRAQRTGHGGTRRGHRNLRPRRGRRCGRPACGLADPAPQAAGRRACGPSKRARPRPRPCRNAT